MKEFCEINVCGLYSAGGDSHWLKGFWYGHIADGRMIVSISDESAYNKFAEDWMPDGSTKGIVVSAPISAVRLVEQFTERVSEMEENRQSGRTSRMVHDAIDMATAMNDRSVAIVTYRANIRYTTDLILAEMNTRGYMFRENRSQARINIPATCGLIQLMSVESKPQTRLEGGLHFRILVDHSVEPKHFARNFTEFVEYCNSSSYPHIHTL